MLTDAELLRRYATGRSEAAFAELVQRHLNLVYFAALRQVGGDTHRAKDVAQTVFTDLARKAARLTEHPTLSGWLHTGTRFAAAKVRRADLSRQQREQEATSMNALLHEPDPAADWERLRPMIDDVIHGLADHDREAVLLRFFEGRAFAEIGAALQLSEDAARRRVDRALEKLRAALARRGVKSTSAALATVFASQVGAAPAGLAGAITAAALGTVAGGVGVTGATFFMSNTSTAIISAVALAAIGSTFYQWNHAQRTAAELAALATDRESLRAQLDSEQQRTKRSARDFAALQEEIQALKARPPAPPPAAPASVQSASASSAPPTGGRTIGLARWEIQQAALNNLRQINAARKQYQLENGHYADSVNTLVGRSRYIKAVRTVDGEDYSQLSMNPDDPLTLTTPGGLNVTYDPKGENTTKLDIPPEVLRVQEMEARLQPLINQAVEAYRSATGKMPASERALIPYFATPAAGADFVEYLEARKTAGP